MLDSRQVAEWLAFDRLEGFGPLHEELLAAVITPIILPSES